jgi:hypothetical protein
VELSSFDDQLVRQKVAAVEFGTVGSDCVDLVG